MRPMTDIRIVLVGAKGSGKSSALNTILGRESSPRPGRTARCLVAGGVVFGRQVTVVDTPGWWMNYFRDDSPVFDLREILLSLSLCPPGPHVFLLVIRVDRAFTETHRRAVQEHLEMIGEHTWSGVMLLFSFGDWLGGAAVEQYIESEGEPLRWLVERCGNRYHILNNKSKGDGFQVRELIGKIEEMAAGGGRHYQIERNVMEQLEGTKRREKERAKERLMNKEKQRRAARSRLERVDPFPALRIVLVGGRKTGKSSCGNTILGRECFATETRTASCAEERAATVDGKAVTVLDTPGRFPVTPDLLTAPPACAVALVVNVSSSFKGADGEALEKQLEAGGGPAWSRAMVLFSNGDWLGDTSIEQRIEGGGEPLRRLVARCGNRYHVLDNTRRGGGAQVNELVELIEEMLGEERAAVPRRDDHVGRSVPAPERREESVTPRKKDLKALAGSRHQAAHDSTESAASASRQPLNSDVAREAGQIVAPPAGRAGRAGLSTLDKESPAPHLASLVSAKETLGWTTTGQQGRPANLNLQRQKHPAVVLIFPQTHHGELEEENMVNLHPPCRPAPRGRALGRLTACGGLRALIDQWGDSSLEELEAFIDSYFEAVREQSMGSLRPPEQNCPGGNEEEVLSSIDRKLSKLELLEEIRRELAELRKSLEHSWKAGAGTQTGESTGR